jgi:hypothetical protein
MPMGSLQAGLNKDTRLVGVFVVQRSVLWMWCGPRTCGIG